MAVKVVEHLHGKGPSAVTGATIYLIQIYSLLCYTQRVTKGSPHGGLFVFLEVWYVSK